MQLHCSDHMLRHLLYANDVTTHLGQVKWTSTDQYRMFLMVSKQNLH